MVSLVLLFGRKSNAVPNNNKVMTNMTFICRERESERGSTLPVLLVERKRKKRYRRKQAAIIAVVTHILHAFMVKSRNTLKRQVYSFPVTMMMMFAG